MTKPELTIERLLIASAIVILFTLTAFGQSNQLTTARMFGDNMVLQRGIDIPVWGWAAPNSTIRVSLNTTSKEMLVDADGSWQVRLAPQKAGGPFKLMVSDGVNEVEYKNVMIGDVWLASGQSNMDREMARHFKDSSDFSEANNSNIRLFMVNRDASTAPLKDLRSGNWMVCDSTKVYQFSAVAYYFGLDLYRELDIPIGLIESTWGGTPVQSWTSPERIKSFDYMQTYMDEIAAINDDMMNVIRADDAIRHRRRELLWNSFDGLQQKVHTSNYNDEAWQTVNIPSPGVHNKNYVWLRRNFTLTKTQAKSDAIFIPGNVSTRVDAWINGERIEEAYFSWAQLDTIFHQKNILKKGENQITIRIGNAQGYTTIQDHEKPPKILAIDSSWQVSLSGEWKYNDQLEPDIALPKYYYTYPSILYNAMIAPMIPYGIKGVIWYQGESNTDRAYLYRELFPAMIEDWRIQWQQGYFPFLYVQLANFMKIEDTPTESDWAELREAQLMTLSQPNSGMAVTIDIGDAKDIHPRNKWDIGSRLALWAKKQAYGMDIETSGPLYKEHKINGDKIEVTFDHAQKGLVYKGDVLEGFAVAGEDQTFHWAEATIQENKVIVHSDEVDEPVAVRYAWAANPRANLYNSEGLPASPFRTDTWKGITDDRTYPR